jgi:alkylation response protein AidB-like acyl-CoA dehydrogenase
MFELSDEQRDIKQAAREFAEGEFAEIAFECDEHETFPVEAWKRACKLGFVGGFIDESYEGPGLGILDCAVIHEEFWRVDPGCGNILLSTLGAEFIHDFGNDEQKKKFLSPLIKAKNKMGAVPNDDYLDHAFSFRKVEENEFVLNGSSDFVINGTHADHLVIVAEGQQPNSDGQGRLSTFIVENNHKGIKHIAFSDKLGIRASNMCKIVFEDAVVPSANLVGAEGDGATQLGAFLDRVSIYSSAQAIGASQGCLDRAVKYAKQRVQFGHPIGWFQMVQFKIAEMATRIEASRSMCYKAARKFDLGKKDRRLLSMAGWFSRETAAIATAETLQIHGGYGYMKELDIERFYRDVQFLEFFGASREKEKVRVAEDSLKKMH